MLYVLLLALGALVVGVLVAKVTARQDVRAEVERFHHARAITTGWAKQDPSRVELSRPDSEPEPQA